MADQNRRPTKLHELIAVAQNLQTQAEKTRLDLKNTFEKKKHHFVESVTKFKPTGENVQERVESQQSLQTTVTKELQWISEKIAAALDVGYQIDLGNQTARADVTLANGDILLRGIPTSQLLQLEKRLNDIRDLVDSIPTLDPTQGFEPDKDKGDGIYRARTVEKERTEKQFDFKVMVPATDKHPAQVKELSTDKVVGHIVKDEWSGMVTVADKGAMMDRVEEVIRAVKKARSRANEIEIDVRNNVIGAKILNYVFKNEKPAA